MTVILNVLMLSLLISIDETDGGVHIAICGQHGTCVPMHQCLTSFAGQCKDVLCCKQAEYKTSLPPVGECICVSDQELCGAGLNPYIHVHVEAVCQCCDCINQCVPLLGIGLCPNYDTDRGECDVKKLFCCKGDSEQDCKCFEECPQSWSPVGKCKKCCQPCTIGKTNITDDQTCEATNAGWRTGLYFWNEMLMIMAILTLDTKILTH